jgi:uncharacterized membrane protein YkoI
MSQRTALWIATALTVFMLMVMGGVMYQVFQKSVSNVQGLQTSAPAQNNTSADAPQMANDQGLWEQIAQRESEFRDLVQQANQKLDESYKQQQELTKQLQAIQAQQANERPQAVQQPQYAVSAQNAIAVALQAVPGAILVRPPELINFKDTPAYEVTLDQGVVYVNATTGEILYNSAAVIVVRSGGGGGGGNANVSAPPPAPVKQTASGEREQEHKEDEHKEEEHKKEEHKEEERKEKSEKESKKR